MVPHVDVHRGRDDHRRRTRKVQRREEIVADTAAELRKNIGSCWSDQQQVSALGNSDVFDGAFEVGLAAGFSKKIGDDFFPGKRCECERADKFAGRTRHDYFYVEAFLLEAAY